MIRLHRPYPALSGWALAGWLLTACLCGAAAEEANDVRLWYTKPADRWEEALPIGSGRLGAMVFGGTAAERIQFNEDTLWMGKPHDYVRAGARDHLDEIRRLLFEGKVEQAVPIIRAKFLSDPVRQEAYQPFGDLRLHFPGHDEAADYRRELDLDAAMARVTYRVGDVSYQREVFASYPDQVIVVHLGADRGGCIRFSLTMDSPHQASRTQAIAPDTLALRGQVRNDGLRFEARLRVRSSGGRTTINDEGVTVEDADAVTLLLAAATSYKNFQDISADPAQRCAATLAKVGNKSDESLRADHVADHRRLFRRVRLDLGRTDRADWPTDQRLRQLAADAGLNANAAKEARSPGARPASGLQADPALAALYFQFGRYLLIASSRPGTQPANLQGVWNELLDPPWESKYTTNINFEMNYWPAELTNLSECHEPLFDLVDDLTISGARTAQKQYGARGWVLHHNTDHWRGTAPINNIDGVWPTGGAWLCHHLWEHYLFTGDKQFLARRAYPAMKGASLFFLDALVRDPKTGWLVTNPSISPEQDPLCVGPTMDNQLIRSLLGYTIEAAEILGIDQDFAAQLAEVRRQLPPNQIGKHGQLQEWLEDIDKPNNTHRHMSPLWGLYPGWEITPDDPKLFDAAKVLLTWRGDGSTGWSYAWRIPLWARVYDGDFAYRQLDLQLARRTFPNLFDKCGPFQVDGNFGASGGMAELLLQSHRRLPGGKTHQLDLLPALPKAWAKGSITGLCARGGFEVDMTWDNGTLSQAIVRSKLGNPCRIQYRNHTIDLRTEIGKTYLFDGQLGAGPRSVSSTPHF
ncbi:MAG: glycoside hydrolase family 95 protein [Isosphaeraceae bacterium]|nr:glycoside hydrolase family 95 protein [Isosphaeraceae bacterium]